MGITIITFGEQDVEDGLGETWANWDGVEDGSTSKGYGFFFLARRDSICTLFQQFSDTSIYLPSWA